MTRKTYETPMTKKKPEKSTVVIAVLIVAMVLAAAGIIVYSKMDPYSKINYDKVLDLGKYKGLKTTETAEAITDEAVHEQIDSELASEATTKTVEKGTVKSGDKITIDYEGTINGEAFAGGTSENQSLVIGSGMMIPGFEEALIGKKIGEETVIDVTFPEDYQAESLAGKDAQFKVKIRNKEKTIPVDYNDEYVQNNLGYDSTKAYEAAVKKKLEKRAREDARQIASESLWMTVLDNTKVKKYPKGLLEDEIAAQKQQYKANAEYDDAEPTEKEYRHMAKDSLKEKLIVHAIAKKEHIKTTDEDFNKLCKDVLRYSGMNRKQFKESTGMSVEEYVKANDDGYTMLHNAVLDFVYDNAKVEK